MSPQSLVERMKALGLVSVKPEVFDRSPGKIRKQDIAPKPKGNPKSPRVKRYATREEAALARKIYRREWFRKVRAATKNKPMNMQSPVGLLAKLAPGKNANNTAKPLTP